MAVNLSPYGGVGAQFFDNAGNVLTGGKIFTYAAGTTTNQATFTTSAGNIAHPNPIILDASGRVPSGGEIWLTDGLSYKFVLKDSNDVLIATYDNVNGINSNFVNFTNEQEIQTATAGQTVFNLTTTTYSPGTNSLSVFVDGVNQYGPGAQYAYLETDADTVTFVNGLHVGALVKFTTSQLNSSAAVDAQQVSYNPPFVGAVATNVEAKLAQTISAKDFGAVGDGVADDTAALQAAIDACYNKRLFIPAGQYKLTGTLSIINNGITIFGENLGSTTFVQHTDNTTFIEIGDGTVGNKPNRVEISNLAFIPKPTAANWTSAYVIDCNYAAYVIIDNIDIFGQAGGSSRLYGGIKFDKTLFSQVSNSDIRYLKGTCIFAIGGANVGEKTVDIRLNSNYFFNYELHGIFLADYTEGIFINDQEVVVTDALSAIYINSNGVNFFITNLNCELKGTTSGIVLDNAGLTQVVGGWWGAGISGYAVDIAAATNNVQFNGVWTSDGPWRIRGNNVSLTGCYCGSLTGLAVPGITVDGSSSSSVDIRNTTVDQFTGGGIALLSQPNEVSIVGVRLYNITGTLISGTGYSYGPVIEGIASKEQLLGNLSKTAAATMTFPYGREVFQITGATPIQNITLQHPGRRLYLQAGTGGFSFTSGGNIQYGSGSVAAFDTVELVCLGDSWYEVGR